MENDAVLKLAQAVVDQELQKAGGRDLSVVLMKIQSSLGKFFDSFCEWLVMEGPRFTLEVVQLENGQIHIHTVVNFPPENQLDTSAQAVIQEDGG